jgi:uncharacterized membrane protein YkoI
MIHRGLCILLGFSCLSGGMSTFMASSALAQDSGNVIKVINKEGGVQSLEIPKQPKAAPQNVMSGQDLLKQMEAAIAQETVAPVKEEQKPVDVEEIIKEVVPESILKERESLPIPADAVPLEEPTNIVPVQAQKEAVQKFEPKAKPKKVIKKKTKKKRKLSPSRQSKAMTHKYVKTNMPPPLPLVKPPKPSYVATTPRIVDYTNLPSGVVIDSDTALRIALEYAPPARSFTVYEGRQHKGRVVYQVTFRTEGGPHDILIDAEDGKVWKK